MAFRISEIVATNMGTFFRKPKEDNYFDKVQVDSRKIKSGDAFWALPGKKVDGHNFIEIAIESGATLLCIRGDMYQEFQSDWERLFHKEDLVVWIVDDTLSALHTLAKQRMSKYQGLRIGVTGSNGKTSTKEMLASVMTRWKTTFVTPGNLNGDIGLPMSVLEMNSECDIAIFEMGTNQLGEISLLADIVKPQFAIVTNIGSAHIGIFKTKDHIAKEKSEIFKYFNDESIAVTDHSPEILNIIKKYPGKYYTYDLSKLEIISLDFEGSQFVYKDQKYQLNLLGLHNIHNAMEVIELASMLNVPTPCIVDGLASVEADFGRLEVIREGTHTFVQDCYNSNLESMSALITLLNTLTTRDKNLILIVGGMKELGEHTEEQHQQLGEKLHSVKFNQLYLIGTETINIYKSFDEPLNVYWARSVDPVVDQIINNITDNSLVVVKGSRSYELEKIYNKYHSQGTY
ncbi:UDP-N-acetylmuramoyl-tripeptide--D-alanyl-D-alanine ligase [Spirochaeta cellobiosiphila]|uniref:UDP-N-acetylmuramoyl-tripeptide--D-alanyl-D- alanine ligase n=1 Tax=Spirochaeta cellobiosiphila TaxID=504483 RepID=UPI00040CD0C3|nr:UDP-N-acetylmuramoyl-tripeptide--D-alanyl-D-alanine ligase [Spirochaeta cellobiosiphila]